MNGAHRPRCDCQVCREVAERGGMPPGDVAKMVRDGTYSAIQQFGWVSHIVASDSSSPTGFNAHTHGFVETLHHPDFQIVLPVAGVVCHEIFGSLFLQIRDGDRFEAGISYSGVIANFDVLMLLAQESGREVLRIIMPNAEGSLGAEEMSDLQRLQFEGT